MRDETVARNYAEALFELAERHEGVEAYGTGVETVALLIDENDEFRQFLDTPRIALAKKKEVVRSVFGETLPARLVNFVLITLDKRRQRLLREIAREYQALLDVHFNRVHVEVTLARELDEQSVEEMEKRLTAALGKTAIPHIRVKRSILGGAIFRTGDTIYDGSLRRRLDGMRRKLLKADIPTMGEV
ncbi:MAG TPA: ATP synthase F1 subunit delta [Gemmatimonadetes bacterium]|nr:ATP synthase F1 subunit delta [Gemmatimonadota bacterium]